MDPSVENKIGLLIEGFKIDPNKAKAASLAGLGGMVGAGLDLYLSGHVDASDFTKPMAAWGLGGAIGGLGLGDEKDEIKSKSKNKKLREIK